MPCILGFFGFILWRCWVFNFIRLTVLCLLVWTGTKPVAAQDFESLFQEFNAASLTKSEKRYLQTALAFEGHYVGLLDGAWGKLSREALGRYSWAEFGTGSANWHMAMLAYSFSNFIERDGWEYFYIEPARVSILWPFQTILRDAPSDGFVNYRHSASSLGISIAIQSQSAAQNSHDYVQSRHELADAPYSVRKSDLAVSTSKQRNGFTLYARSNFVNGAWSTVLLSADKRDEALLTAMAASIKVGRADTLIIPRNGKLARAIYKTVALLENAEEEPSQSVATRKPDLEPRDDVKRGSGSGFYVSSSGVVLTNAHVVEGCASVFVDDVPANVLAESQEFDLALLATNKTPSSVAVFSAASANLNADVLAVGFPYGGLLGGLNVTRGSVSSLKGLAGDLTTMQITAPIQTGNSGGPVLASDGEVLGVVVSKLDARKTVELMGDTPQNVNFAVRGEIARLFMSQNGVEPMLSLDNNELEPEELAQKAAKFTVFVECR